MENTIREGKMEGRRWNVESKKWKLDVRPGLPYLSFFLLLSARLAQ